VGAASSREIKDEIMSKNNLTGEKNGSIYTISFNRPEKRNAINVEMFTGICELAEGQIGDPDIRAIILKGEGEMFSAGVDFNSLGAEVATCLGAEAAGGAALRALTYRFQQYFNRLGIELALACDIRLMSDDCIWALPELKLGVIADVGGTSRLARLIGPARALEIFLTAREYTAQQALDWGLVNYIYPAKDLLAEAENMARDMAATAPLAGGAAKKIIKRGDGVDLMTQMDMEANHNSILLRTEDFQEGLAAMMEKRSPKWKKR
jgi:enoyl-CoA hydratase/carnithine racemase